MKKIESYLTVEVAERLRDIEAGQKEIPVGPKEPSCRHVANLSQSDGITWVIEASTTKDQRAVKRIVQQVISVFFASAHQLPVVRRLTGLESNTELTRDCTSFLCSPSSDCVNIRDTQSPSSTKSRLC